MKMVKIKDEIVPSLVQGCMRIGGLKEKELDELIKTDLTLGINFFDHADIYGGGTCEEVFGNYLHHHPALRDEIKIQSKCGIHRGEKIGYYDFSKDYILACVDQSLSRLQTDHLDYLLLHRPDALMDPFEVQDAFQHLYTSGKVLHFGVSNQSPAQMELMKMGVKFPIEVNQMQMSIMHTPMLDAGFNVNTKFDNGIDRDLGTIEYCRTHGITLQCWSPFQFGMFEGVFLDNEKFPEVNVVINELAHKYHVSNSAIAVNWLLVHPASMQVILGSTRPSRLREIEESCDFSLTKEEWYRIYLAAGNLLP